jgi:hypothetical protein
LRRRLGFDELEEIDPLSLFDRQESHTRADTEVLDDNAAQEVRISTVALPDKFATHLTKRVRMMTAPKRLKMRKKIEFHWE